MFPFVLCYRFSRGREKDGVCVLYSGVRWFVLFGFGGGVICVFFRGGGYRVRLCMSVAVIPLGFSCVVIFRVGIGWLLYVGAIIFM